MEMNHIIRKAALAGFIGASILGSGCSTPPKETWTKIRTKGLVTVLRNIHKDNLTPSTGQIAKSDGEKKETTTNTVAINDRGVGGSDAIEAIVIPDKLGYVRTPFTKPPRPVDVRGFKAGNPVRCPYTRKVFLVPTAAVEKEKHLIRSLLTGGTKKAETKTKVSLPSKPSVPAKPKVTNPPKRKVAATVPPKPKASPKKTAPKPKEQPKVATNRKKTSDEAGVGAGTPDKPEAFAANKKNNPPEPKVAAAPKEIKPKEIPVGTRVEGKPGFVFSPFAERHQLVNVEGLTAGIAVRCPYTGQIFRVPADKAQASSEVTKDVDTANVTVDKPKDNAKKTAE